MGGLGSGRFRYDKGKATVLNHRQVDIRKLKAWGYLRPGHVFHLTWKSHPPVSIWGLCDDRQVVFSLDRPDPKRSGQTYPVGLITTPCHMGGNRPWFLCPTLGCGRRVAILYGGPVFQCRLCCNLVYPSQRETNVERSTRRATAIRDKMGWRASILEGCGPRPKGMHRQTYDRLCAEYRMHAANVLKAF